MNKSSIIILIVAAVVFTGLGFVVGNVMAAGSVPGSADDPVMTQAGVEKLVGNRLTDLQNQIDDLQAIVKSVTGDTDPVTPPANNNGGTTPVTDPDDNNSAATQTVTVSADSVNIRATASTSASIVTTVSKGTVLTYVSQTSASDGTWYKIRTSGGVEGYIRSDLCSSPS